GVSGLIIYTGVELGRSAADYLMGRAPTKLTMDEIRDEAAAVAGVAGVHGVHVHDYGTRRAISLHVEVVSPMDITAAHEIADEVERRIAEKMNADTVVHIDPPGDGEGSA
ncbi:MAG: cation transporter dimerization domain-containing protein, partial [Patescibacteria group bacterium]